MVRDFCGHGIGRRFHEPPNVLHFGRPGEGPVLRPGMFFTIEPMINAGRPEVKVLDDGWTAVTRDRCLSAQFEHTIGVTETGCEIFTLSPAGYTEAPLHGRLNDLRAQAAGGCARIRMAGPGCGLGYPGASKFARRKKPREESCKMTNRLTRRAALGAGLAAVASPVALRHALRRCPDQDRHAAAR